MHMQFYSLTLSSIFSLRRLLSTEKAWYSKCLITGERIILDITLDADKSAFSELFLETVSFFRLKKCYAWDSVCVIKAHELYDNALTGLSKLKRVVVKWDITCNIDIKTTDSKISYLHEGSLLLNTAVELILSILFCFIKRLLIFLLSFFSCLLSFKCPGILSCRSSIGLFGFVILLFLGSLLRRIFYGFFFREFYTAFLYGTNDIVIRRHITSCHIDIADLDLVCSLELVSDTDLCSFSNRIDYSLPVWFAKHIRPSGRYINIGDKTTCRAVVIINIGCKTNKVSYITRSVLTVTGNIVLDKLWYLSVNDREISTVNAAEQKIYFCSEILLEFFNKRDNAVIVLKWINTA